MWLILSRGAAGVGSALIERRNPTPSRPEKVGVDWCANSPTPVFALKLVGYDASGVAGVDVI